MQTVGPYDIRSRNVTLSIRKLVRRWARQKGIVRVLLATPVPLYLSMLLISLGGAVYLWRIVTDDRDIPVVEPWLFASGVVLFLLIVFLLGRRQ